MSNLPKHENSPYLFKLFYFVDLFLVMSKKLCLFLVNQLSLIIYINIGFMFKFFPFYLSVDPYQVFFQYVLYFFQHIMHTVPHYDRYRYNTRTQQTNILINKTKDKSTMPQGSQHHHTGRKRSKDRDADMHASRLVADVDEFADLDEKRYQMTLTK